MSDLSAADIAAALDQPSPTSEQAAVIESPEHACLVVAGAGAGKTETMAGRVVWLVANRLVRPDQVLGLTFTRKAAAELAARVRRRLAQLVRRGVVDAQTLAAGEPTVSTYDSYAGRIVAEHALRLGREPGQRLISQTIAWQLARRVVDVYDGPMDHVQVQPPTVTADVLALADGLAQHQVTPEELQAYCTKLHDLLVALPAAKSKRSGASLPKDLTAVTAALAARCQLLPLVAAYQEAKRVAQVLDFADQMALAAELASAFAGVVAGERVRYRAVLLDEYQDTSHAQLVFLRALFGRTHPDEQAGPRPWLTAVGDPSQAIYGWRGASQGTLAAFPADFGVGAAGVLTLATSFRNTGSVLAVANHLGAPLRNASIATPVLSAPDGAGRADVRCALYLSVDEEAAAVADRVAELWRSGNADRTAGEGAGGGAAEPGCSIAVLLRTWRQLPRIEAQLRSRGVPLEILGVGGLLVEPEVVDVVATLRVLADPARGDALMRLLTGARWRIGPRDLAALGRWARRSAPAQPAPVGGTDLEPDEVDGASIIDALDDLPPPGWLSEQGRARMARLAAELRGLRGRLAQPLPDLVLDVVRTTGLDVEVLAAGAAGEPARATLDRFVEVAAEFAETRSDGSAGTAAGAAGSAGGDVEFGGRVGTLPAFLDYLDAAAVEERGLDRPDDEPTLPESQAGVQVRNDRVQLLTVHGAKGLEWDAVVVPGLVDKIFPGIRAADVKGWLTQRGALPWPLRGDRAGLPVATLDTAADRAGALAAFERFKTDVGEHLLAEERRLAYVAVTRARSVLFCTGFRFDDTAKPRQDSPFLVAVRDACETGAGTVEVWTPLPSEDEPNPLFAQGKARAAWPTDPLGDRRAAIAEAARLVGPAAGSAGAVDPEVRAAMREWDRDVDVLLAERAERRAVLDVVLPRQLSVSQLVTLRRDPAELARQLRRPMPAPPAPLARRGTAFHAWLEQRFAAPQLLDVDELPGSADADAAPDADLAALQKAFLASSWAARRPVDVEVPFELVVDDTVVRGRMDAVFTDADGGSTVVDWKTGRRPAGATAAAAAVQLAAYRLAWADLSGTALGLVRATFVYLHEGGQGDYSPADLLDRDGLVELLQHVDQA